jgi:hypothetical protein
MAIIHPFFKRTVDGRRRLRCGAVPCYAASENREWLTVNIMIRILLLSPEILLNTHFQTLVSKYSDLAIVGIESSLDRVIECAKDLKPDVLIAHGEDIATDPIILGILGGGIIPVIIILNPAGNRLRLYRSEEWQVSEPEDLEEAIRAEPMLG